MQAAVLSRGRPNRTGLRWLPCCPETPHTYTEQGSEACMPVLLPAVAAAKQVDSRVEVEGGWDVLEALSNLSHDVALKTSFSVPCVSSSGRLPRKKGSA